LTASRCSGATRRGVALRPRPAAGLRGDSRLGRRQGQAVVIPPGLPWRNGYIESFNGQARDECLDINGFWSLAHARIVITARRTTTTSAADTVRSAINPKRSTLPPAPADERLSPRKQFSGSGHRALCA
jgi:transposase InsO family protein